MAKIKLCGFKDINDIVFALNSGADFIGLNNISISKRFVHADDILKILNSLPLDKRKKIVVLMNYFDSDFVFNLKELGVEYLQSYLNENEENILLKLDFKIFKVLHVTAHEDLLLLRDSKLTKFDKILLDSKVKNELGGTGQSFSWDLLNDVDEKLFENLILAGGINKTNLHTILADGFIKFVDIASGIEDENGGKSYALIKELITTAKARQ
jgi:phosphoribosylanthranilate isomerase